MGLMCGGMGENWKFYILGVVFKIEDYISRLCGVDFKKLRQYV